MKMLTPHTQGCPRASVGDCCSSYSSYMIIDFYNSKAFILGKD